MITVYDKNETVFTHNGLCVLTDCITATITEELNGVYEVEVEYPLDSYGKYLNLIEDNIIKADDQLFRIYYKKRTLAGINVKARHIFYDSLDNFIETLTLTGVSGAAALSAVYGNTQYAHIFTSTSDVATPGNFVFDKVNPVTAIMGTGGIIEQIGGELERDNFTVNLHQARGADRGVLVSYGKNIQGIEETLDTSGIVTRMMPIGKNGLMLSQKYVDSPYVYNFPHPKIVPVDFADIDNLVDLLAASATYLTDNKLDIPQYNYKIDFVELTKTVEYQNYAILETVYMADTVTVKHTKLNINLKAKVIKITKNLITGRIEKIELGSFKPNMASLSKTIQAVKNDLAQTKSDLELAISNATSLITGAMGGNVVIRQDGNGKPIEILIMDTADVATAQKVWRWNLGGLGYSSTGINGPYGLAITQDGAIVADFITAGTMDASLIKAGILESFDTTTWINMLNGTFSLADKLTFDGTTFTIDLQDKLGGNNLIWNSNADMSFDAQQSFIYRKIPNGSNFDYKWIRAATDTSTVVNQGNYNRSSPYTLTTWFAKPSNYKQWDFWKISASDIAGGGLPSGAVLGDIFYSDNNNGGYSSGDWEKDNGDEKARFVINDYYGPAPKIDIIGTQSDKKMVAYYQTSMPHSEYINIADTAAYNLFVGDLWWDYDASPATVSVPASWNGGIGTSIDTSGGYPSGNAFKVTAGATDEYCCTDELVDLKPATVYTYQGLIRTFLTAGLGAQIIVQEIDVNLAIIAEHATALQAGTQAYTGYTGSFTTTNTTRYHRIKLVVKAGTGYAFFDQLKLEQGGNPTPWCCSSNELKTGVFEVTDKYARFKSADGSYTMFDPANSGITWYNATTKRNYHYLSETGSGQTPAGGGSVTVTLQDTLFKGKDFTVNVSLKNVNGYNDGSNCLVTAGVQVDSIDANKGTFVVTGSRVSRDVLIPANKGSDYVVFTYTATY